MLRSRMITPGFKLYFGIAVFALIGAITFGINTVLQTEAESVRDRLDEYGVVSTLTGPLTVGWKGSVGNHLGYAVLLTLAVVAGFLAFLLIAFRDADPDAVAQVARTESVPLTRAPGGASFAPIVGTFALAVIAIGWVLNTAVFYAGIVLLAAVIGTWTVRAWAERATGDDVVNRQIYHRIIDPLKVPIVGVALVGFVVVGISRLLLALPDKTSSSLVFGIAGLIIFVVIVGIALVPKLNKSITVALLAIGAVLVLAAGIYGIAAGARDVEHHGGEGGAATEEHSPEAGGSAGANESESEGSLAPAGAGAQR